MSIGPILAVLSRIHVSIFMLRLNAGAGALVKQRQLLGGEALVVWHLDELSHELLPLGLAVLLSQLLGIGGLFLEAQLPSGYMR